MQKIYNIIEELNKKYKAQYESVKDRLSKNSEAYKLIAWEISSSNIDKIKLCEEKVSKNLDEKANLLEELIRILDKHISELESEKKKNISLLQKIGIQNTINLLSNERVLVVYNLNRIRPIIPNESMAGEHFDNNNVKSAIESAGQAFAELNGNKEKIQADKSNQGK